MSIYALDASPAYDPAFHVYITELNEESFHKLYPKFLEIAESYKFLYQWNMTKILGREKAPEKPKRIDDWFMVKDVGLNSVYASGWKVLADLARDIDDTETANYCDSQYKISRDAIISKMFVKEQDRFQTLYIDSDGVEKASIANTVQNLFPLLLHDLPTDNVKKIVSEVSSEQKFMGPFAVTTVAMDDPQFSATFDVDLMWRGPVWGFTNWFVMEGLGMHKEMDVQKKILQKWVALVQTSGIYEHYNPINGDPYGPEGLGMSTLVCDWIYRYGWDKNPPNREDIYQYVNADPAPNPNPNPTLPGPTSVSNERQ